MTDLGHGQNEVFPKPVNCTDQATIDNININGNTINATSGDLTVSATGSANDVYVTPGTNGQVIVNNILINDNIITTSSGQDMFIFASSGDININPDLRIHFGDPPTSDFTHMSFVGGGGSISSSSSIAYFNSPDSTYPITQDVRFAHDNITYFFDAYNDNTNERSSDAGSNFKIEKKADQLTFNYASAFAQGAIVTWAEAFKITTSGLDIPEAAKFPLDHVDGFVVKYSSTTAVAITSGGIMANGKYYTLASDTTHSMTSLASGFDHHYIYIDDSASTAPSATIIDATTEPAWSDSKRGWYNGDDRCIGVVASTTGASTVIYFNALNRGKNVEFVTGVGSSYLPSMATNMIPDNTWDTPDTNDGSIVTPVNAFEMKFRIIATHVGFEAAAWLTNAEFAATGAGVGEYFYFAGDGGFYMLGYLDLGASRNVKISGATGDDNNLSLYCHGFTYSR